MNESDTAEVIHGDQSKPFLGVRFVLCGFDPVRKEEVLSALLSGGGVDVRRYCPDCSHVIVDKVVYDDPICVSARRDGKVAVTSLWVEHCCEVGMPVDHNSILYRPLRDLNGIPGAKSLTICLTGYTGESRDDIMIMVGLMGATFSRSLITATATHLVCYKFEGEKYRTAKKVSNIKIVNHRWLEDCLKAWALLPETDYNKSGYHLEMMESEVKDSEEEQEDIPAQSNREKKMVTSPHNSRSANQSLLKLDCLNVTNSNISKPLQDANILLQSSKKQDLSEDLNMCASRALSDQNFNEVSSSAGKGPKPAHGETAACSDKLPDLPLTDNVLAYGATCTEQASGVFRKSYSRKSRMKNTLIMEEEKGNGGTPLTLNAGRHDKGQNLISLLDLESDGLHTAGADSHTKVASPFGNEQSYISSEKRMLPTPSSSSKKQRKTCSQETKRDGALIASGAEVLEAVSDAKNGLESTNRSPVKIFNIPTPDGARELSCKQALETGFPETMEDVSADVEVQPQELQAIKVTSPGSRVKTKNLNEFAGVQLLKGNTESQTKKLKKRCLSMKTDKSKQTFVKGHANNQNRSIYLNKNGESAVCSTGGEEIKGNDDLNCEKADVASMHNRDSIKDSGKSKSLESEAKEMRQLFDVTEAPDDTEDELNDGVPCGKAFDFESPRSVEEEEGNMLNTDFHPVENCNLETMVDKADLNSDATYVMKQPNGKKCSLSKDNEVIPRATKVAQSKEGAQKKRIMTKNSMKGKGKQANNSMEAEKENISDVNGEMQESHKKSYKSKDIEGKEEVTRGLSVSSKDHKIGKVTTETCKKPNKGVETTENRYFIVSGHKLQKKEFQQVIKRLKGRSCRDSHTWSYHATHFILPDPVRRTEKFFAAAASGRWILKVDYLTACNEAGMFVAEEPYEWHKKGLSDDLAISLEAPRTWRLLRQRTGHGAFYGMRIVTYGEINRPSLDTLKRVVKAGDGTILATCPSYARFLKSDDIDFAIVCPGTPRQDMWVQEFLRLKIPCVSVDYLVEYICKPGYSLDKHVLYNTHAWAEESLQKLLKRMHGEAEVDDLAPPGDCVDNGGNDTRPSKSAKRKRLSYT